MPGSSSGGSELPPGARPVFGLLGVTLVLGVLAALVLLGGALLVVVLPALLLLAGGSFLLFALRRGQLGSRLGGWAAGLASRGGGRGLSGAGGGGAPGGAPPAPPLATAWAVSLLLGGLGRLAGALGGLLRRHATLERRLHADLAARCGACGELVAGLAEGGRPRPAELLPAPPIIRELALGSGGSQHLHASVTLLCPQRGVLGLLEVEATLRPRAGGGEARGWRERLRAAVAWRPGAPRAAEAEAAAAVEAAAAAAGAAARAAAERAGAAPGDFVAELRVLLAENAAAAEAEAAAGGGEPPLAINIHRATLSTSEGRSLDLTDAMGGLPQQARQQARGAGGAATRARAAGGRIIDAEVREKS